MKLIETYPVEIKIIQYLNENSYINDTAEGGLKMALRWLAEAPAVDPEDLRPKWKWQFGGDGIVECSECEEAWDERQLHPRRYCPNCGAKMN